MVVAFIYIRKRGYVSKRDHLTAKVVLKTIWDATPSLFLMLLGVTYLFGLAEWNGSFDCIKCLTPKEAQTKNAEDKDHEQQTAGATGAF